MKRVSLNLYYGCLKEGESYYLTAEKHIKDKTKFMDKMFLLFSGERDWKGLFDMMPEAHNDDLYLINISSEFSDKFDKFNDRFINKASLSDNWETEKKRKFYSLEMIKDEGFIIDSVDKPFYKKKYGKIEYDCSRTNAETFELTDELVNLCPVNKNKDNNGCPEPAEFTMIVKSIKII